MRLTSLVMILAVALAACAAQTPPVLSGTVERDAGQYRLGSDDKLRIAVYGEEPLAGEYVVNGEGTLSFPLVGMVPARNLTITEFQRTLTEKLRGFLTDPKVTVDVVEYRPFFILGEVNKAGQYVYKNGLTALSAVATAEGFTYRANKRTVIIQRSGEAEEREYPLSAATKIYPGDTVRVKERFF